MIFDDEPVKLAKEESKLKSGIQGKATKKNVFRMFSGEWRRPIRVSGNLLAFCTFEWVNEREDQCFRKNQERGNVLIKLGIQIFNSDGQVIRTAARRHLNSIAGLTHPICQIRNRTGNITLAYSKKIMNEYARAKMPRIGKVDAPCEEGKE